MPTDKPIHSTPPASSKLSNSAPSATADQFQEIRSPKPAPSFSTKPKPVDIPLKDVTLFTKGAFATEGNVIRTSERVNTTTGGTPFFFFVLQNEVCCF